MLFYFGLLAGHILLFGDVLEVLLKRLTLRRSLRAPDRDSFASEACVYLNSLMLTATGKDIPGGRALAALLCAFALMFALLSRVLTLPASAFASLMFAAAPVIILELRSENERGKASREGLSMVSELHREYRIRNRNIYEALSYTVDNSESFPVCRRLLTRLLLRLRSAGGSLDIAKGLRQFSFSLGTSWGHMLATCIRVAVSEGTDVGEGLADIIEQLKAAEKNAEKRKRMNSESVRMAVFLIPLMYVGSFFLSVNYLDMRPSKFFRNQFLTAEGLMFFLLLTIMFVFNLCAIRLVTNRKIDY